MSEQNIELQRRVSAAFNARDIEAGLAYCDPSIEWRYYTSVGDGEGTNRLSASCADG